MALQRSAGSCGPGYWLHVRHAGMVQATAWRIQGVHPTPVACCAPTFESHALGVAADPVAVGVESVGVAARDPDRTADLTAVEVLDHGQTG